MVIKGSSRGHDRRDIRRLAEHLLSGENESVEVVAITGTAASDLHEAFVEMAMVAKGTRCAKHLYHCSINLGHDEASEMATARWIEAVDELAKRLGLEGHSRVIVCHRKRGRDHVHAVISRVDPVSLKVTSDGHNYRTHEECSRALEARWGLRPVVGAHTKPADQPRPVAAATHADWQASERTGLKVADVAGRIAAAWRGSATGREFGAALEIMGLSLASGRRGLVVVDGAGTPHSIPRRLGMKAAEVWGKLGDVDPAAVPTVEQVKAMKASKGRGTAMDGTKVFGVAAVVPGGNPADWEKLGKYWRGLGFLPEQRPDGLWVQAHGAWFRDLGDRIELHCQGEPTDAQIAAMVAAGKARGWTGIRFFGGSPSFQKRARIEALRQGYRLEDISLECEDAIGGMAPSPVRDEMPDYLKKALGIPDPNAPRRPGRPRQTRPASPEAPAKVPVMSPSSDVRAEDELRDLGLDEAPAGHGPANH